MTRRIKPLLRVCICGGGNLAHALAGAIGSNPAIEVRVLTRRPTEWSSLVKVYWHDQLSLGRISKVSSSAATVVPGSDVVLLAVPAFVRRSLLEQVCPHIGPSTWIGSIPGAECFDWLANEVLGPTVRIFGTERTPYICRIVEYGQSVRLSGVRPRLYLGALPLSDVLEIARTLESMLGMPMEPLPNYLAVTLTPANAIFHSSRLYSLFRAWREPVKYPRKILFYEEWDDAATEVYSTCDQELQAVVKKLPLDLSSVKPVLERYNATTLDEITQQIRASPALYEIEAPLSYRENGYQPDFEHRFFTEDISYGLISLRGIADLADVPTPMIDEILYWAQEHMGRKFLEGKVLFGASNRDLPLPTSFGIEDVATMVRRAAY